MLTSSAIDFSSLIALAVGSALGGLLRFLMVDWTERLWGKRFPWGTMAVNLSGALAVGWLGALILAGLVERQMSLFLLTGLLGSYTTVSALSLSTLVMAREGRAQAALFNLGATLLLGLALAAAGFALGHAVHA